MVALNFKKTETKHQRCVDKIFLVMLPASSTFLALPLKVLADDGALRQQVAAPAGPDRRRQAEGGRAHLGVGGLNKSQM